MAWPLRRQALTSANPHTNVEFRPADDLANILDDESCGPRRQLSSSRSSTTMLNGKRLSTSFLAPRAPAAPDRLVRGTTSSASRPIAASIEQIPRPIRHVFSRTKRRLKCLFSSLFKDADASHYRRPSRSCIRCRKESRSKSLAVPASTWERRRRISSSHPPAASASAGASKLLTSSRASSARSASGSISASSQSRRNVPDPINPPVADTVASAWCAPMAYPTTSMPMRRTRRWKTSARRVSAALAWATTLSAVMPKCLNSTSAGADRPKPWRPTKTPFSPM